MTNALYAHQLLPIWDSCPGTACKRLAGSCDFSPPQYTAGFSAFGCDPSDRVSQLRCCDSRRLHYQDHQGPVSRIQNCVREQPRLIASNIATQSCRELSVSTWRKPSQHLLTGFLVLRQCVSPTISHEKPKNLESEPESARQPTGNVMTGWSSPETATMPEIKPRSRHIGPSRGK